MKRLGLVAIVGLMTACEEYPAQFPPPITGISQAQVENESAPIAVASIPTSAGGTVDEATIEATLDGFGSWQADRAYGTIWIPSPNAVGAGFVPYASHGHWTQTDVGWYWESDYSWGWLTFHYGRWIQFAGDWAWVPGTAFAPAWVDWRMNDQYVGWSPTAPAGDEEDPSFVFCPYAALGLEDIWSQLIFGAAAVPYYALTELLPQFAGIAGAVYSWGPQYAPNSTASITPVETAWHHDANPRAGVASSGGASGSTATPAGSTTMAHTNEPRPQAATPTVSVLQPGSVPANPVIIGYRPHATSFNTHYTTTRESDQHVPAPSLDGLPVNPDSAQSAITPHGFSPGETAYFRPSSPGQAPSNRTPTDRPWALQSAIEPLTPPQIHPWYAAPAHYPWTIPSATEPVLSAPIHPAYTAPAYRSSYTPPAYHPTYSAPAYHPSYSAPAYHSSYSAPAYHSSYHAPSGAHFGSRR